MKTFYFLFTKIFKLIILRPVFYFFMIAVIGFFFLNPPTFNFGDHATWGLLFQKNLVNYVSRLNTIDKSFTDYFKDTYRDFHFEKLARSDALETYNLDPKLDLGWIVNPNYYSNYVFSRLSTLLFYFLSFKKLDVETCETIFSFLSFCLTYFFAYKFGSFVIDKKFGLILAIFSISNVYYNQLVRSTMNPFAVDYPFLLFGSLYYLFLLHQTANKKKNLTTFLFSITLSLSFLNGYPNTNFLLYILLILFWILIFVQNKIFHNSKYKPVSWKTYFKIIIYTFLGILIISGFWSFLLGENILFSLESILHDRIWGQILSGTFLTNEIYKFNLWQFPFILFNMLKVLLIGSNVHVGPHEPSFLHDISFLNIIEFISFIFSIFFILKKFFSKKIENNIMLLFFLFFLQRLISNSANYLIVGRYTFDFYFIAVILSAYGFWYLFKKKLSANNNSVYNKLFLFVLLVSLIINILTFNNKFILAYDEGVKQMYGIFQLRKLYQEEISKDHNFLIYDYSRSNGYEYYIDLITLLENKTDYDIFDVVFNDFGIKDNHDFDSYLKTMSYKNIYIIVPVGYSKLGSSLMFEPLYNFTLSRKFSKYFSPYKIYKTIYNRRGIPTFWIYKFNKNNSPFFSIDINDKKTNYTLKFSNPVKIDYLDIPGGVEKIELYFNKRKLKLSFKDYNFDRFHFSFDNNSVIDIYNNFNFGEKTNNIIANDAIITETNDTDGSLVNFLNPQKIPASTYFKYQINYPINKVYVNVPFVFYNDQFFINEFNLYFKTDKKEHWERIFRKKSNGNLLYTDYDDYRKFETLPNFNPNRHFNANAVLNLFNTKSLYLQYQYSSIYSQSVLPYSSFSLPESTRNFVKFEVDTSEFKFVKKIEIQDLELKISYKKFQKENAYNILSLGFK